MVTLVWWLVGWFVHSFATLVKIPRIVQLVDFEMAIAI